MKKLLTLTLITVLLSGILTSCKQSELPPELTQAQDNANANVSYLDEYVIPTEYTKPYMTRGVFSCYAVYKNNFYYRNALGYIEYVELDDDMTDVRTLEKGETNDFPEQHSICNDPLCEHYHEGETCLAYMKLSPAEFVIDEVESAGGAPVFYYFAPLSVTTPSDYYIYRIDSGAGTKEKLATVKDPINKMAVMEDSIYFVTQSSDDTYKINMVKKSGGEVYTLSPNGEYLRMIGGNKDGIYLNDNKGRIYAVNSDFESADVIYTLKELYPSSTGYYGAFVEGDYLYFYSDYEAVPYQEDNNTVDYIKHNIRRVRIDSPEGDGELVAENVFDEAVLGVYNNVLYYGPFDVRIGMAEENPDTYCDDFIHSNGTICGVDLETLEKTDIVSDCGLNFSTGPHLITDKYLLGIIFPYRNGLGLDQNSSGRWMHLYVFETGEIYRLCGCT